MIDEPASFQKRSDENYKDEWISRLNNSTNETTLKGWFDNPCKEGSQYIQENYEEGDHGNYHNESDKLDKLEVKHVEEQLLDRRWKYTWLICLAWKSQLTSTLLFWLQLQLWLKNQKPVYCCVPLRPNCRKNYDSKPLWWE